MSESLLRESLLCASRLCKSLLCENGHLCAPTMLRLAVLRITELTGFDRIIDVQSGEIDLEQIVLAQ
jgi:hypothetical protein